jgi:hypothetical protein
MLDFEELLLNKKQNILLILYIHAHLLDVLSYVKYITKINFTALYYCGY